MFFPTRTPVDPDPKRLSALRVSLNAPVVSVEGLPAGPARAAIVIWWDLDQRCVLEIRVRSQASGQLLAYDFEGSLETAADVESALDAALNFSEGMGFLFDDDILSGDDTGGRERVLRAWAEFQGSDADALDLGAELSGTPTAAPAVDDEALELTDLAEESLRDLDDLDPPDLDQPLPGLDDEKPDPRAVASRAPEPDPRATLTKFRVATEPAPEAPPGPAPEESETPARTALGRVPIVRRKRKKNAQERPSLLLRILGAF